MFCMLVTCIRVYSSVWKYCPCGLEATADDFVLNEVCRLRPAMVGRWLLVLGFSVLVRHPYCHRLYVHAIFLLALGAFN